MFKLMFWNKAGEALLIKDKQSILYFPLYELAYSTAHQLIPIMVKNGAVSMTISDTSKCTYKEYPIINGTKFKFY